jgi:tripartite ATP-independent transporter DctP family solute receptor
MTMTSSEISRARKLGGLLVAAALVGGLAACSSGADTAQSDGSDGTADSGEAVTLRLGHVHAEDSPPQEAAVELADLVDEASDGQCTIDIYPAGQLGSWEELQEGLEVGSVDIVIESLGSLERYTPLAAIEGLPFLYDDPDQFFEVWESPLAEEILQTVEDESGFRLLGTLYRGGRLLNSTRPVETVGDAAGLKLRVPTQQTYIDTWQAIGASPTPMAFTEVFSALEQGAIDGQENPIDIIRFNSMYEVAPYVTETNHLYGNYHFQFWGESFDALPETCQTALTDSIDQVSAEYRQKTLDSYEEHKAFLEENGTTFFPIDIEEWRDKVTSVIDKADPTVKDWAERIQNGDY